MKKLIVLILSILLISCVSAQIKKTEIQGLKECEGLEYLPLEVLIQGYDLKTIESWKVIRESEPTYPSKEARGLLMNEKYLYKLYQHPESEASAAMIIYIVRDDFIRAERVGLLMNHPVFGTRLIALFDRYLNTDTWYEFDAYLYDEQHPEDAPIKGDAVLYRSSSVMRIYRPPRSMPIFFKTG